MHPLGTRSLVGTPTWQSWAGAVLAVAVSGLVINAYLVLVARNVSPAEYGYFAAFWSLALLIGFGAFLPVEQELARLLAADPNARVRVLSGAAKLAGATAVSAVAVLALASPLLAPALGGQTSMLVALAALCLVSAAQFLARGLLVGLGRIGRGGVVLLADAVLRILLATVVILLGAASSTTFAWALVAAVAMAHLPVLVVLLTGLLRSHPARQTGSAATARAMSAAAGPLLLGSICAQLLLNGVPVLVSALAGPDARVRVGQFLAAFLLARVPLFAAVPLQTAIIPTLTRQAMHGRSALRKPALCAGAGLLAGMAVAAAAALLAGPTLIRWIFGPAYLIGAGDLALLAVGVLAHLALILTAQVLVAAARHRAVATSWLVGLAVLGVVVAAVPDLVLGAELGFLIGSAAGCAVGVAQLLGRPVWGLRHAR